MKTINEIVKEAGISRQTLYNVVKKAGLSIDNFTTEKRGKTRYFDEEAEKKLVKLLQQGCKDNVNVKDKLTTANETIERQRIDNERLQREAEELRKQLDELKRERDQLTERANSLDEERRVMLGTIATQAKTIEGYRQERETAKLTSGSTTSAGWIRRTLARITGKGKREE